MFRVRRQFRKIKDKINNTFYAIGDQNLMDELKQFTMQNPNHIEANLLYGKYFKSLVHLDKAIKRKPNLCDAYYYRYEIYKKNRYKYKNYEELVEYDRQAYYNLLNVIKYLQKSKIINSFTLRYIYSDLSEYELIFGERDKAVHYISKAIELSGFRHAEFFNKRGELYLLLKELKKALEDYNKSLELDPSQNEIYSDRGRIKKDLGDYEGAKQDFEMGKKELFIFSDKVNGKEIKKVFEKNYIRNCSNKSECPKCGSLRVANYSYGLPDFDNLTSEEKEQLDKGELILAGCIIEDNSPTNICRDCGTQWGFIQIDRK